MSSLSRGIPRASLFNLPICINLLATNNWLAHSPNLFTSFSSLSLRDQLQVPFYMEIIILASCSIWMLRNDLIFRNIQPGVQTFVTIFKEFTLVLLRAKGSLHIPMKHMARQLCVIFLIFFVSFFRETDPLVWFL